EIVGAVIYRLRDAVSAGDTIGDGPESAHAGFVRAVVPASARRIVVAVEIDRDRAVNVGHDDGHRTVNRQFLPRLELLDLLKQRRQVNVQRAERSLQRLHPDVERRSRAAGRVGDLNVLPGEEVSSHYAVFLPSAFHMNGTGFTILDDPW